MRFNAHLFSGLLLVGLTALAAPGRAALLPADIDGDTHISAKDVVMVLQAGLGFIQLTPDQMDAADLSPEPGVGPKAGQPYGDGKIDIRDVVATLRWRLNPPSTLEPTYANIQKEVFDKSCAFSSCHSSGPLGRKGNLVLESGTAYDQLVNVVCTLDSDKTQKRTRVAPGSPEASMLYIKLTHPGPDEGDKMPKNTETGLDPSKVDLVRRWILKGAPKDGDLTPTPPSDNEKLPIDPNYNDDGDVYLAPPPPGEGVQMVIPAFDVAQGKEIQRNYYMKLPVDQDVDINKIEFAFNRGSHHLNIFKSDTDDLPETVNGQPNFDEGFQAVQWERWFLVVDSQNGSLGWQLPPGVAFHLKARQQLDLQIHYVNIGDQKTANGRGKAFVNWWFAKPGTVTDHMSAMFAQNRTIVLAPHAFSTFQKAVIFPNDVKVLAMTGHFHGRGVEFSVNRWDGKNVGEEVYRSLAWGDPPFLIYPTAVPIKGGEGLIYTTTYYNDTDVPIKFGAHVDTEEHANLFVFFYPGLEDGKAIYDF